MKAMVPSFKNKFPLPDEALVAAFEARLPAALPIAYRNFLLQVNGGYPTPDCVPVARYTDIAVQEIYGLGPDDKNYSSLGYQLRMFRERLPNEFIFIGNEGFGNKLVLGISGKYLGKVMIWDHEDESDDGEPATYRNIYPVADSWNEFLGSFYEFEDDTPLTEMDVFVNTADLEAVRRYLDSGAEVDAPVQYEESLLSRLVLRPDLDLAIVDLLIERGADVLKPIESAKIFRNKPLFERLVAKVADLEAADKYGKTLLMDAVLFSNDVLVEVLLQAGANPCKVNKFGHGVLDTIDMKTKRQDRGYENLLRVRPILEAAIEAWNSNSR